MTDRPPPAPVRWEDLEDRADRCLRCLYWWVSHGVPGEDGYGCTLIESSAAERADMDRHTKELERAGVPPDQAARRAYAGLCYCGCSPNRSSGKSEPRSIAMRRRASKDRHACTGPSWSPLPTRRSAAVMRSPGR